MWFLLIFACLFVGWSVIGIVGFVLLRVIHQRRKPVCQAYV